ncbi:hypothetical protein HPO96_36110 [Kribbella sandramycini]|uniref:Secreted protein n=1 Tax=Kribbella sandramycini TaxID=60450 RepID=A0A7Y4L7B2_9ACTN|nr:hypothetical protein [Kribbella sandramycini]MBB6570193.1 hypothetical protein [Kribbella sandramycini]NOL45682.1 hypothetical protein [Kribbella sandramycini]
MRFATRALGVAVGSAALLAVGLTPAVAEDGHVYVRVLTYPSGGTSGGESDADLNFTAARSVTYNNWTINDTCPGDGYRVIARARALLSNGNYANGTWHEDDGTCESDDWGPYSGRELNTSANIVKAGVQVCVDLGAELKCNTTFRDNPHT